MPGLLGTDPTGAALMALGGSMVRGDFGGGLLGANEAINNSLDSNLKRQLVGTQMQDMQQQIQLRALQADMARRRADWIEQMMGGGSPAGAAPSAPGVGAQPGGAMGAGPMSAGPQPAPAQAGPAGPFPGVDRSAALTDLVFNDGKNIGNWINDRTKPNIQMINGVPVDVNHLPPGMSIPQMSPTGQGYQIVPDQNAPGGMRVIAPAGAPQLYATYKGIDAQIGAQSDLIQRWNPETQRMEYVTKSQALDAARQPVAQPSGGEASMRTQVSGDMGPNPASLDREIKATQTDLLRVSDPNSKAQLQAYLSDLQAQKARLGSQGPLSAQPSPAEASAANANKTFLEGRAKGANEYEGSLNARVQQGADMNLRLQEQLDALNKFRAGGGAETRAQLAQYAQSIPGMPAWVVKGVAGGDLAAMQEFNKLAAQTAMEQLKQSMGGAGRISQYEFKVFQNNNPNLSTDPDAIRKIFDFNTKIYSRDLQEQQAFNSFIKQGQDPAQFPSYWQQRQVQDGHTNPSMRAATESAPKANVLDALPKTAAKGTRVRDTQTGDILTFNGLSWVKGK